MMLALWHITFVEKGLQAVLRPKTPDYSAPGENVEINRISLAPTINECIKGLGNENDFNTKERKIYAYKILVEEGDEMSGITPLLQTLKELEKRGIPGRILTTDYLTFSDPKALRKLEEFSNLHVKMYVTD